jgi:hypothetical protein
MSCVSKAALGGISYIEERPRPRLQIGPLTFVAYSKVKS